MPRNLDPLMANALQSGIVVPFFALSIAFRSQTFYLWSGTWPMLWQGITWAGTGDFGKIASVHESQDVQAIGTSVTLSGVNTAILQECIEDVAIGAPANLYFGCLDPSNMQPIGAPYLLYAGLVDQPSVTYGPNQECSITVKLESHMIRLGAGTNRHYTSADQRLRFPLDTFFQWVEPLSDTTLRFGTK